MQFPGAGTICVSSGRGRGAADSVLRAPSRHRSPSPFERDECDRESAHFLERPRASRRRRPKSFRERRLGSQDRVRSIERTAKFSDRRPFGGANGVGSGLFREAATNGCPSGEERTPRSVDRGVFHFRGGVAGIWGMGGVRAVVSHLSLGGPGRSGGLTDNTESRCLSLLVSPGELSLVQSVRPNEKPPDLLAEGLGSVARRASAVGRCIRVK